MGDATLEMRLTKGDSVYYNKTYCREYLLYSVENQEERLGEFSGLAGEITIVSNDAALDGCDVSLIQKFYPEFDYEVRSPYRIRIPQQGLSAHAAHAIIGIFRDGADEWTEFLVYLVHRLETEETVSYRNHVDYNGPSTWSQSWFSMETLYKVCQEYPDFPPEGKSFANTRLAHTKFKTLFLKPEVIRETLEEANKCSKCGKEVFELEFFNPAVERYNVEHCAVTEPWKYDPASTRVSLRRKKGMTLKRHPSKLDDSYLGVMVEMLRYPTTPLFALGLMLNQGGYKE